MSGIKLIPMTLMALAAGMAQAQLKPLETTAGWKTACETSPGNRVQLREDITVSVGFPADSPEMVNSACIIELVGDAEIQFDKIGLRFAGPLTITGGSKTGIAVQEATLAAPTVSVQLSGLEGYMQLNRARIDALVGDLSLQFGNITKLEWFQSRLAGSPSTAATLSAAGRIRVTAGSLMTASMKETVLAGRAGIVWQTTGEGAELKSDSSEWKAPAGSIAVNFGAARSKSEIGFSSFDARDGVAIAFARDETDLKLIRSSMQSDGPLQLTASGSKAGIGITAGQFGGASFQIAAGTGAGAVEGNVSVEMIDLATAGNVSLVTGAIGKTVVKGSLLQSGSAVEIRSNPAAGGVCEAVENRITAPLTSICP